MFMQRSPVSEEKDAELEHAWSGSESWAHRGVEVDRGWPTGFTSVRWGYVLSQFKIVLEKPCGIRRWGRAILLTLRVVPHLRCATSPLISRCVSPRSLFKPLFVYRTYSIG